MAAKTTQQVQGPLQEVFDGVDSIAATQTVMTAEEQRLSPRRNLSIPVWIRVVGGAPGSPAQSRQLVNMSLSGLGISSKTRYRQGQQVSVDVCVNNTTWSGLMKVVHCTEEAGAYKVGLSANTEPASVEADAGEDNLGRNSSTVADLRPLQEQIPMAMRAYRQARVSWGLLGTPIKKNIRRIIRSLSPIEDNYKGPSRRRHRRMYLTGDVHLLVPTYYEGKWLRPRILDIGEGGVGLSVPYTLSNDDIERELTGDFRIAPQVPVIVGIGNNPQTIWLPAQITYCSGPDEGAMRVGVEFNTRAPRAAFGA